MDTGKLGEEEIFAASMISETAALMGSGLTKDEIFGGIAAMMNLAEVWRWRENEGGRPLRATVGCAQFYAEGGECGVELSGRWRLGYVPGAGPDGDSMVTRERAPDGGWLVQDTPMGGAGKVFFKRGNDGKVRTSRRIHFFRGKLWDPVRGEAADEGYDENGGISFSRSFMDGRAAGEKPTPLKLGGGVAPNRVGGKGRETRLR
jgi:hypothetical protein